MADSDLILQIDGDLKDFEKALREVNKKAENLSRTTAEAFKKSSKENQKAQINSWKEIEKSGLESTDKLKQGLSKLGQVGTTAVKAIGTAFTVVSAGIATAISSGSTFEQKMKDVQAISGAAGEDFEKLTAKAREMGEKTAYSATEAGQAFEYMAMAGWDTSQMVDGIAGIMNLAAASGEDLGRVSDIVTDALTAFGLSAKDSGHFADVLAMTASKANTNIGLMGYSFQYVAPVAGALKFSIEDVAVAIGLMANAGIKGEKSGTALRSIFTRLVKPPKMAQAAIDQLNIAVTNTDGTMRPLNDILIDLRKSFKNLTDAEKAEKAAMLAGQDAMSGFLALVDASDDDFNKLTYEINNAADSAERMAEIKLDSLHGQFLILKSAVQETQLTLYDSFKKALKEGVQDGTKSIQGLNDELKTNLKPLLDDVGQKMGETTAKFFEFVQQALPKVLEGFGYVLEHIEEIGNAFKIFAGTVLAFKGVSIISAFVGVVLQAAKAIKTATTAMKSLTLAMIKNPFTAVATAVTILIGAIYTLWETSDDFRIGVVKIWYIIEYEVMSRIKVLADAYDKLSDIANSFGEIIPKINMGEVQDWRTKISDYSRDLRNARENGRKNSLDVQIEEIKEEIKKLEEAQRELENTTGNATGGYKSDKQILSPSDILPGIKTEKEKRKKQAEKDAQVYADDYLNMLVKSFNGKKEDTKEKISPFSEAVGRSLSRSIRNAIDSEYASTEEAIRNLGANLMFSLADEMMTKAFTDLQSTFLDIGNFIISGFKSVFGIASPSKVFKKIGYENMRGLALGFSDNQEIVNSATAGVADKVKAGFENASPTITPNFNLQTLKDMFNINAVTQPQLAGDVAGGSNNIVVNINSEFHLTGGGAGANSQSVTADDLNAFQKEISKSIENITLNVIQKNMRSGGILSR